MKFLREDNFEEKLLLEASVVGNNLFLEGPMVQCNAKNRNGRTYPLESVGRVAVDRYNEEFIKDGRAIGQLEHPDYPMPKLSEAAVFMKDPWSWQGDNAHGKMQVLDNQKGRIIKSLSEAGYRLGTSTRGLGEVDRNGVVREGYFITASDVVDKPSGQVCYMKSIHESVQWELVNGVWAPVGENIDKIDGFIKEHQFDDSAIIKKFKAVLEHL